MKPFDFRKALLRQDGTILFGAQNGFLRLNPQLSNKSIAANVSFSSLHVLGKRQSTNEMPLDLQSRKTIKLLHTENSIRINFFIPDYRDPENNLYEFKLDDYENDWQQTAALPEAVYRKLPPGNYHFRVRAKGYRYSDAIESSIHLHILPPWYWAWWSKSLYFLLLVSLIYWIYRYQLKRQLAIAEANRLKELDTFKTRLYTNITHEFRTPLTVILGWSDQLQDKVIASGKEGLQMIRQNGDRLLNLVNQMLELQKLEAGSMQVHLVQDDIIQYLRYLVESFSSLATSKNIELQFQSDPESLVIDYDPDKVQHIISNIVTNALKFTNVGGFVTITFKQDSNSQLTISVRDNGIGISEEKLPYIFDRFYQADDSSIRLGEGTGIGLSLTRELVLLLGGEILVKSIPGAGSEFKVVLPITRNAQAMSPDLNEIKSPEHIAPEEMASRDQEEPNNDLFQILIIEDNPDVVQYIRSVLQNDYHLTTAVDGQKGCQVAFENIPDVIISDVMMPKMDGFQVCNALKTDARTSHIPIILLTAKADIDSKLEGLQYGADAYLTKPFIKEELLVRIQSLITQKQRLQIHYQQLFGVADALAATGADIGISAPENAFITKVKAVITEHLEDSTFGVDQLCHAMAMSNSQLYRKLKSQTGLSAHNIMQSIRLQNAKSLLKDTERTIAEVAYDCGFNDPEYFSQVFKKEFGITPSDFRNS